MDLITHIKAFLSEYELVITILIVPFLIGVWTCAKWLYDYFKELKKEININYSAQSSVINPNYCFTRLELINHKSKKVLGSRIEIVLYDDNALYTLDLYQKPFVINPEDVFKTDIEEVSHYLCNGDWIDFRFLLINKQFYFNIYENNKIVYTSKKYARNIPKKPILPVKICTAVFENTVHSFDWDYGFVYKDAITNRQYTGFMNRRSIACEHLITGIAAKDIYTPQNVMELLISRGAKDVIMKRLAHATDKYRHIEPKKLGNVIPKGNKGTKENPHVIKADDIHDFKVKES